MMTVFRLASRSGIVMEKKLVYITSLLFCLSSVTASADDPNSSTAENASASIAQAVANADTDTNPKPSGGTAHDGSKTAQVPVLKHLVRVGDVIAANDIDYQRIAPGEVRDNVITDANALIGKSPKHTLMQGRPIRQDEISSPTVLRKGTRVTMVYRSDNLEIRTLGEALDNGAKGDVVRVKNLTSKAIINGVVVNGDTISIASPESNSAEAM